MAFEMPNYIKSLLIPNGKQPASRRVWSIPLEGIWLPFFTATNVTGDTAIPYEALGAPLRLAYSPDGSVKFSKSGRPVMRVTKEVADHIRLIRDNFTATLIAHAEQVSADNPDAYNQMVETSRLAGEPIISKDRRNMEKAVAQAMAEATKQADKSPKAKSKAPERELVPA